MKKMKKLVALLLAVLMCASLCGCQELEDMRAAQAFLQQDGTILWNGNVYRQLEYVPQEFRFYSDQQVILTLPDVPVLLSGTFGESFMADVEKVILRSWYYNGGQAYFCREDRYEDVSAYLLQEVKLDTYYYVYWDGSDEAKYYYLTDDQQAVVDKLMYSLDFTESRTDLSYEMDEFCLTLGKCDEKHLLEDGYVLEIAAQKDGYYLITPENEMSAVPAEYQPVFEEIVKTFYEAEIAPYVFAE